MSIHGVVRTDLMAGTKQPADIVSAKYLPSTTATEIDNGCVVKIGALVSGEYNVFTADTPAANTPIAQIALVASPEVMDDPRKKKLTDFYNLAGEVVRCYRLRSGDIFSVTKTVLDGDATPDVGDLIELKDGNKLNVVDSATGESATVVGDIVDINQADGLTWYAIRVR
jgi:hypothetical protein